MVSAVVVMAGRIAPSADRHSRVDLLAAVADDAPLGPTRAVARSRSMPAPGVKSARAPARRGHLEMSPASPPGGKTAPLARPQYTPGGCHRRGRRPDRPE